MTDTSPKFILKAEEAKTIERIVEFVASLKEFDSAPQFEASWQSEYDECDSHWSNWVNITTGRPNGNLNVSFTLCMNSPREHCTSINDVTCAEYYPYSHKLVLKSEIWQSEYEFTVEAEKD